MTDIIGYLVFSIIIAFALSIIIYVISRLQMKAWLTELEKFFKNQCNNNLKSEENGKESKE